MHIVSPLPPPPERHYQSCPAATEKEREEGEGRNERMEKVTLPLCLSLSFPESPSCATGRPFAPWPGLSPLNFSLLAETLVVVLLDLGLGFDFDFMKCPEAWSVPKV